MQWRRRLNLAGAVLVSIALVRLTGNVIWPYRTKADAQLRSTVRRLQSSAGDDPTFLLQPTGQGFPTLLWYLKENGRSYAHGMTASPGELNKTGSAWVITCAADHERLGAALAQQANMEWALWSKQDLQIGPKEYPPLTLAVAHLTQKTAWNPTQQD
jgi:hypothetical protein